MRIAYGLKQRQPRTGCLWMTEGRHPAGLHRLGLLRGGLARLPHEASGNPSWPAMREKGDFFAGVTIRTNGDSPTRAADRLAGAPTPDGRHMWNDGGARMGKGQRLGFRVFPG